MYCWHSRKKDDQIILCDTSGMKERIYDIKVTSKLYKRNLDYYSKVSNKRTLFNNRTGGDIILQKV